MKTIRYGYYNESKITELLFGRKVKVVNENELLLDNGLVLEIQANEGCGGCVSGWYQLKELNGCDNAITNVEFVCEGINDGDGWHDTSYKIFVLAEDTRIKLLQVDGTDGNGYYGTGYSIVVKIKELDKDESHDDENAKEDE